MSATLTAKFDTRRGAEMAVEHLVQAHHIERTDIFITPEGSENSAGEEIAGSDTESDSPSPEERHDAALTGKVVVSVDVQDGGNVDAIRAAFAEFDGSDVTAG